MRKSVPGFSKRQLGQLKSLIVIPDWIKLAEEGQPKETEWYYKNQPVHSIENASVIFIPVDFMRIIQDNRSHVFLYGAGIYWTKFSIRSQKGITIDARYLTAILLPEEQWLNNHFNTEPFIFPPPHDFILGDLLQEFPFYALNPGDDTTEYSKRAFSRGLILAQLVFPFKEPLVMLRKTTQSYEEFDSPNAPMRVLISNYRNSKDIINEISLETPNERYEETMPGIRQIKSNLLDIFPEKWKNKVYLQGLRREIANISKDFAFIGAPLILK